MVCETEETEQRQGKRGSMTASSVPSGLRNGDGEIVL